MDGYPNVGAKYGEGIYVSPSAEFAVKYAQERPFESNSGNEYLLVFQVRVKPDRIHKETDDIWRVSKARYCRPCGILLAVE